MHINIILSKQGKPFQPIVVIYFHDGRSIIYYELFRFSWWQVEIFMTIDQDLHDHKSRISWRQVKIFTITGQYFHYKKSRFSWWLVKIFMMTGPDFILNDRDFHEDRLSFFLSFLVLLKETRTRGESKTSSASFWC